MSESNTKKKAMKKGAIIVLVAVILFIMLGCKGNYIHVDAKNKTGPWDGSKTHPLAKIQAGLNKAQAGKYDGVVVHGGVYNENVVVEDGLTLMRAKGSTTVLVQGSSSSPTITAKGRNYIGDLLIDGGSVGIHVEIGKILSVYDTPLTIITDNIIESSTAIQVETDQNLAFATKVRKKPWVSISGNWIRSGLVAGGTGIRVDLTGPKTGEIGLKMDINDNIIWNKSTGIALSAEGQGTNPGGFVRANIIGEIANNLLYGNGLNGIRMDSRNLGDASILVFGNTIVHGGGHAILATSAAGPDGDASTHPNVTNNILAYNKGYGYLEFSKKTSASDLQNNIFYQNSQGHYGDIDTQKTINSQADLNIPIVQNKVVFYSGGGNLVANPQFDKGVLHWNGKNWPGEKAGEFFLIQKGGNKSLGVDGGFGSALDGGFSKKTTSVNYSHDTGKADIGFHYTKQ